MLPYRPRDRLPSCARASPPPPPPHPGLSSEPSRFACTRSLKDAPEGFVVGSPGEVAQSGGTGPFLLKLKSGGGGGGGGGKRSRSASGCASTAGVGSGGGMEARIRFSLAWRRDVRLDYCLEFKARGSGPGSGRRAGRCRRVVGPKAVVAAAEAAATDCAAASPPGCRATVDGIFCVSGPRVVAHAAWGPLR